MQLFEVQAPLLGEIAPLLGSSVESAQWLLVSHEGAWSRWGRLPPLVVRGRDSNRSVFTDSCCTRYWEGGKTGPDLCESVFRNYPIHAGNKAKPARWGWPGGSLGSAQGIGGAGAPIGGCDLEGFLAHSSISRCTSANGSKILKEFFESFSGNPSLTKLLIQLY